MLCRKGLHDLDDPANVGVQASTGRQFCKACKREYRKAKRRERRPTSTLCRKQLHDMGDEANVYVRPSDGRRECRACKELAAERRRQPRAAGQESRRQEETSTAMTRAPMAGARPFGGGRAAAEYRLARMVRASRGL
jgi:tryptophanyl-tRNA synthetase